MPNKTYELRNLYFQQSGYSDDAPESYRPLLLQWPSNCYFDKFTPDAELLQNTLAPQDRYQTRSIADQIFGSQKQLEYLSLKHLTNLFYERCKLHKQHIQDIEHRHIEIQEKKFGVEINHTPDNAKRLSNLESQLLQLEQQRRDEELTFWKDTSELREKLFEKASVYRAASQRYSVFSDVEGKYDG